MDPRKLFADERYSGICVYCGGPHDTDDRAAPMLDDPVSRAIVPLQDLTEEQRRAFETAPEEPVTGWPEIGSRAFLRTMVVWEEAFLDNDWQEVQEGRYRYLVMEG